MAVLAVANPSSSVGKSTTAVNLAAALGAVGSQVLVVDCDWQMGATRALHKRLKTVGLLGVLARDLSPEVAIAPTTAPRVDLLPASPPLRHLEGDPHPDTWFRDVLGDLPGQYAHVILDCPSSMSLFARNALAMADWVLIPVSAGRLHQSEGLQRLADEVSRLATSANPGPRVLGVALTMFEASSAISEEVLGAVQERYPRELLRSRVPLDDHLREANEEGSSVLDFDPFSAGANAYRALSEEVSSRLSAFVRV
jgi:chromosome partitioning protein